LYPHFFFRIKFKQAGTIPSQAGMPTGSPDSGSRLLGPILQSLRHEPGDGSPSCSPVSTADIHPLLVRPARTHDAFPQAAGLTGDSHSCFLVASGQRQRRAPSPAVVSSPAHVRPASSGPRARHIALPCHALGLIAFSRSGMPCRLPQIRPSLLFFGRGR
jgi:hypothetical protein